MRRFFDFENYLLTLIDIPETGELARAIPEAASASHRNVRASFNGCPHWFRIVENRRVNRIPKGSKSFKMSVSRRQQSRLWGNNLQRSKGEVPLSLRDSEVQSNPGARHHVVLSAGTQRYISSSDCRRGNRAPLPAIQ